MNTRTHTLRFDIAKTLSDASGAITVGWVVTTPVSAGLTTSLT